VADLRFVEKCSQDVSSAMETVHYAGHKIKYSVFYVCHIRFYVINLVVFSFPSIIFCLIENR